MFLSAFVENCVDPIQKRIIQKLLPKSSEMAIVVPFNQSDEKPSDILSFIHKTS